MTLFQNDRFESLALRGRTALHNNEKYFSFFVRKVSSLLIAFLGEKCFLPKCRSGLHALFKYYDLSLQRPECVFSLSSCHGARPACFYLGLETQLRLFISRSLSRNEEIRHGESTGVECFAFDRSIWKLQGSRSSEPGPKIDIFSLKSNYKTHLYVINHPSEENTDFKVKHPVCFPVTALPLQKHHDDFVIIVPLFVSIVLTSVSLKTLFLVLLVCELELN